MARKTSRQAEACRLCGRLEELQDSHLLPRWVYRRIEKTPGAGPNSAILFRDGLAFRGGKQITEYLLCRSCEGLFGRWETYASEVALQLDGTFPAREKCLPLGEVDGENELLYAAVLDVEKLTRFAVSIVWRASVSETFKLVQLGELEKHLGSYLLDPNGALPSCANLFVQFFRSGGTELMSGHVAAGVSSELSSTGVHVHSFTVCGMSFQLSLSGGVDHGRRSLCIAKTRFVVLTNAREISEGAADLLRRTNAPAWKKLGAYRGEIAAEYLRRRLGKT